MIREMFSSLSPNKRHLILGKTVDTTSLSVNAQAISPVIRQSPTKLGQASKIYGLSPAPSRPSSAKRTPSPSLAGHENEARTNFTVKNFSHFCFDDDVCILCNYHRILLRGISRKNTSIYIKILDSIIRKIPEDICFYDHYYLTQYYALLSNPVYLIMNTIIASS